MKTTQVTTKIKQVEPQPAQSKSKNKKNKKKNKKQGSNVDKASLESQTTTTTENVEKTDKMSSSKINQATSKKVEISKDDASSEGTSNPSPNNSSENLVSSECEQPKQKSSTVFEVDIAKSTEESVFQNSPEKKAKTQKRPSSDILVTSITEDNITAQLTDLNSTQLDCEEILSNYEMTSSNTQHQLAEQLTNGLTNGHTQPHTNGLSNRQTEEVTVISVSPSSKRKNEEAKQSTAPKKQPRTELNTNIHAIANQKGNLLNLIPYYRVCRG